MLIEESITEAKSQDEEEELLLLRIKTLEQANMKRCATIDSLTDTVNKQASEINAVTKHRNNLLEVSKTAHALLYSCGSNKKAGLVVKIKDLIVGLENTCHSAGVGNMKQFPFIADKVEHLKQLYVLALKYRDRADHFEAKASKLNAEKLALLRIISEICSGGWVEISIKIRTKYRAWLELRKKQGK